jgi:hypothetical protein
MNLNTTISFLPCLALVGKANQKKLGILGEKENPPKLPNILRSKNDVNYIQTIVSRMPPEYNEVPKDLKTIPYDPPHL